LILGAAQAIFWDHQKRRQVDLMPEFILHFDEVKVADNNKIGGKGCTLARLRQADLPVPPGVIITTDAYRAFVAANNLNGLIAEALTDDDLTTASIRSIEVGFEEAEMPLAVAAAIRDAYLALGEGQVAVRSSALAEDGEAASFAGQHETFLGVVGCDAVLAAVRRCWASLWSERALAYRRRLGFEGDAPAMAVVVQKMVPAAQAGVAFTLDPVSGCRDVVVVEAVAEGCEAMVSGRAAPYRYVVQRGSPYLESEDGVLDAVRLAAVVRLARQVESWAGQPQDVEWALDDDGRVHLLQARPITVTGSTASDGVIRWTRDNVGEVIPDPVTPLSWSVLEPLGNRSFARVRRRLGIGNCSVAGLFGRFYGRVYFNQTLYQATMDRFYISRTSWHTIPRLAVTALLAWRLLRCLPGEGERVIGTILGRRRSEAALDLAVLAPAEVLARLVDWRRLGAAAMEVHLAVTVIADLLYQALNRLLACWGDGTTMAATVTTGLTGVRSAEAGQALATLARRACQDDDLRALVLTAAPEVFSTRLAETGAGRALSAQIGAFLAEHGHSAAQEFELAAPRWRDNPAIMLGALQAQVHAAAKGAAADPSAARRAAVARIESRLEPPKRWLFRRLLRWAQAFTVARENLKYHFVIAHSRLRDLYLALAAWLVAARRLAGTDGVFFLTAEEVAALVEGGLTPDEGQERVAEHRRAWEADRTAVPPSAFDQLADGRLRPVAPSVVPGSDTGQLLRGLAASPGLHTGRARVLCSPTDGAGIEPGEVLVVPATSPGWAPLLLAAGALVTEIGGTLSHGAIIAREYGLPAVLNVADATRCIRTGQLVHVDGSRGIVQLIGEAT
jgi:phosphohistidine swiveling domain-containing protein